MSHEEDNQTDIEEELAERSKEKKRGDQPLSPAVVRQNQLLYGRDSTDVEPSTIHEQGPLEGRPPESNPLASLGLSRLARRLQEPPQELSIVVNGVGIHLPVIGWDLQTRALLCLVTGQVRCDLPLTGDVKIHLGEKILTATFVGQWHKIDWLPFQLVAFALTEGE